MVYSETDRYPLHITAIIKAVKYWTRLVQLPSGRLCKQTYLMLYDLLCRGINNWASQDENILCFIGFGYVWLFQEISDVKTFIKIIKLRLTDTYLQEWLTDIYSSDIYQIYRSF